MAYDNVPPEINVGSGRSRRDIGVRPEPSPAATVTIIDIDEDGNVTKVPTTITAYGPDGPGL